MTQPDAFRLSRRDALMLTLAAGATAALPRTMFAADPPARITKAIPTTGEHLPVIGIGTNAFTAAKRDELRAVLKRLTELGGMVVDTAAAYGESEQVIGELMTELGIRDRIFLATKLTSGSATETGVDGAASLQRSLERLQTDHVDLLQVHNMNGVEPLWPQMNEWKKAGKIRYIGMTTSFERDHAKMAALMGRLSFDFVQVDYSIANRDAAKTVLPVALERKIAVIVNMPFGGRSGATLSLSNDRPLPPFAAQLGVTDWAQLLLKYVVSHPAVTCAVAGSTKVGHVEDDQAAGLGPLPDAEMRTRIEQYWDRLLG